MTATELAVVIHRRAGRQIAIVDLLTLILFLTLAELLHGKLAIELEVTH